MINTRVATKGQRWRQRRVALAREACPAPLTSTATEGLTQETLFKKTWPKMASEGR